jgi:hypothetical protein
MNIMQGIAKNNAAESKMNEANVNYARDEELSLLSR